MKRKKLAILFLSLCMILQNNIYVFAEEATDEIVDDITEEEVEEVSDDRIIPNGISISGIDVSGLTVTEALEVVNESFSVYDDVKFTLKANDKEVNATGADLSICAKNTDVAAKAATYGSYGNFAERFKAAKDLENGKKKDFKISVGANASDIVTYLQSIEHKVNQEPVNNGLIRENGEFKYIEGKSGVVVQIGKSATDIVEFIEKDWDGGDCVLNLTMDVKEPIGTKDELDSITDILGSYNTDYSTSSAARKNNVANGARLINGRVLYPGEEFSVLSAITPFTAENGYQLAGSYENGTTVETYGGGICQVSTTLYGAVRAAEVSVVTRSCHSMVVNYVLPSQDAAISESGSKDFQIRNNKETPIYLEGYVADNKIYFNIWGKETREATHKVSYETEITGVTIQDTTYVADPGLSLGVMKTTTSGHTGYTAKLWKITTENGEEVERKNYNNSRYNPSNRTVNVGIACADPSASAAMADAIASQNPDVIANAIAVYAPGVVNTVSFTIQPKYTVTVPEDAQEQTDDGITNDPSAVNETTGVVTPQ